MRQFRLVENNHPATKGLCAAYKTWHVEAQVGSLFWKEWVKYGKTFHDLAEAEEWYDGVIVREIEPQTRVLKTTK